MTSRKTILPILPETFEAMVAPWLKGIVHNDIVSAVSYPASDRQRRMLQLLGDTKLQKKYFGDPNKYIWVGVDFRVDPVEDPADLERHIIRKLQELSRMKFSEGIPFDEALKRFERRTHKKVILYCFGCEKLLRTRAISLLIWFTVQSRIDSLRMLLFFEANLFSPPALELFGSVPAFQPRIAYMTLYKEADVRQFIRHMTQSEWHIVIDSKIMDRIVSECGGVFLLVKEALWHLRDHPKAPMDSVFSHTEMQFNLASLWNGFAKEEQDVLERIVKRENLDDRINDQSIKYLEQMGFLSRERTGWRLAVPLLSRYISGRFAQQNHLALSDKKEIYFNGVPVDAHFSRAQKRVLSYLLQYPGQVVSRDIVGQLLWPHDTENRYSDWAVDSQISRLRMRLVQLGFLSQTLETKKGKGFIFRITL